MHWALIVLGVLVGLFGLMAVVGWMSPVGHTVTRSARLPAAADEVYAVISDLGHTPQWWPQTASAERLDDRNGHAVWRQKLRNGMALDLEIIETTAPRRFSTRIANDDLPFGGTWIYTITPEGEHCSVTVTENGKIYNPIFRCLARYVFGHAATIESYLRALSARFDTARNGD